MRAWVASAAAVQGIRSSRSQARQEPLPDAGAEDAAVIAAVTRLVAEADAEVDDILRMAGRSLPSGLNKEVDRLKQSAEATEVATDLAGLLWAECEEAPPIATMLEEPATQVMLEAVAEARRQAARRLELVVSSARRAPEVTSAPATFNAPPPLEPTRTSASTGANAERLKRAAALGSRRPIMPLLAGSAAGAILLLGRRLRRS